MIIAAVLALGLTVGGSDFDEAFARAKRYEQDQKAGFYAETVFLPKVSKTLSNVLQGCAKTLKLKTGPYPFVVVIDYRDGKPARILLDKETPVGRCAADGLATADYPDNPPYPDYAVDLEITYNVTGKPGA
jgi:hypothetical protein